MIVNSNSLIIGVQDQKLFNRTYSIAIGAPNQTAAIQYANFSIPGKNNTVIPPSPLRIKFDIEKNLVGTPNNAKFELFNMSVNSRQGIKKGYIILLQAGYNGLIQTLFTGNVVPLGLKTERHGADTITKIECGDGESAIVMTNLDQSYPPGTDLFQVLQDISDEMGVDTNVDPDGTGVGIVVGIPNYTYGRGLTISGPVNRSLDKLLKPRGLRWSVQNGNLTIMPATGYDGKSAIVVSALTGMIGTPSNNDQYMEFASLLNPNIVPGALVQMISENTALNGFYKVMTAHYEGDTHDNQWQVKTQCIAMPNIIQKLPLVKQGKFSTGVIVA